MSSFLSDPRRENLRTRSALRKALLNTDEWVVEFEYQDASGNRSRRVVSPIRFVDGDRFLGLCLSREEPRQFYVSRCRHAESKAAHDYLMPWPMESLPLEQSPSGNASHTGSTVSSSN